MTMKHLAIWRGGDFSQHYQFTTTLNRGRGPSILSVKVVGKKGAGQQFKVNLKKSDGTFIRAFWLVPNTPCNNGTLNWNLDMVNQVSLQYRKKMGEVTSFW